MAKGKKTSSKSPKKTKGKGKLAKGASSGKMLEALKRYIRSHADDFLKDPNINSIGVGYKIVDGKQTPVLALQFAVNQKVSLETLPEVSAVRIPPTIEVEGTAIPTDVVQRSFKPSYQLVQSTEKDERKKRFERLVPGISVAHPECTAGTLGCIVHDKQSGEAAMLSNWHVLHTRRGNIGDTIVQPGPFDDNRVENNRAVTEPSWSCR
jgi:endonuclease G, mitochondrial